MNTSANTRNSKTANISRARIAIAIIQCFLLIGCSCSDVVSAPICKIKVLPKTDNQIPPDDSLEAQFSDLRVGQFSRYIDPQEIHLDSNNVLPQVTVTPVDYDAPASHHGEHTLSLPESLRPDKAPELSQARAESECRHCPSDRIVAQQLEKAGALSSTQMKVRGNKNSPLRVVRKFPTGRVEAVRQISAVFSKPMVAQSEIGQPFKTTHQVTLSPSRPGQWKWADERTLLFKPKAKFLPQGSLYTIAIAAGVSAIDGSRLAQRETWTIATPEPRIDLASAVGTATGENILIQASQPVKRESVIAKTHLIADGKSVPLRDCSEAKCKEIYGSLFGVGTTRFALCPVSLRELKKARSAKVIIDAGILPLEGGLAAQKRVVSAVKWAPANAEIALQHQKQDFEPLEPWCLWFGGLLDIESIKPEMIDIQPALADMKAIVKDNMLYVSGDSQPNTNYSITLKAGIMGRWRGGTKYFPLAKDRTVTVRVRTFVPKFIKPDPCLWLDPQGNRQFPIHSINIHKADVAIYAGNPKLAVDSNFMSQTALFKQTVQLNFKQDETAMTLIDLKPFLIRTNQLIVTVKNADAPTKLPQFDYTNARPRLTGEYQCWVQSTNLNLSVVSTTNKVFCLLTDRKTGKPVANAKIVIADVTKNYLPTAKESKYSANTNIDGIVEIANFSAYTMIGAVSASTLDDRVVVASRAIMTTYRLPTVNKDLTYKWVTSFERSAVQRLTDVSFYGWVREVSQNQLKIPSNCDVQYEVLDSQHQAIGNGALELTSNGGFQGKIHVPENTSCGVCSLNVSLLRDGKEIAKQAQIGSFEIAEQTLEPATKLELSKEVIPVLRVNDQVTTSAQVKTREGNPIANSKVTWRAWLSQSKWSPPGWKDFTFSQEVSADCPQFQTVQLPNYVTIKSDENGRSAVSTSYKAELTTPAVLIVEATMSDPTLTQVVNYEALPSNCLIGISRAIKQTDNKQIVDINYLVCEVTGKPVAGRPVKLSIHDVQSGFPLFEESVVSGETVHKIHAVVAGLGPLNVIAEVTDEENHTHRSNILSQADSRRAMNNADRKAAISIGLVGCNSVNNYAELTSPFSNSKGIFISNSTSNSSCKVVENYGKPVAENFQIAPLPFPTEVFAKLYNTDMKTPGNPEAALGDCFASGLETPQMSVSLATDNKSTIAGTTAEIKVKARNTDGSPASNAEFVLTGAEFGSGLGPVESQFFNDLQLQSSNFACVTALSTDRMKASLNEEEASLLFRSQMSNFPQSQQNTCCHSGNYSPEPTTEAVQTTATQLASMDKNGCATVTVCIPANAKNYKIVALVVSGKDQFGSASLCLPCSQPLAVSALNPTYLYAEDTYTLPVNIKNSSTVEVPVTIEAKRKESPAFVRLGDLKIPPSTNYRLLIPKADWLGNTFEIKVDSGSNQRILTFDIKPVKAPAMAARISGKKEKTILAALEGAVTKMQNRACDSTDQLASRIITALTLKAIKRDTSFSGCCDDITREDVCQLTKLNADTSGWLRWINQLNAYQDYLDTDFSIKQGALALAMASDAGLNIEGPSIRSVSERLEYVMDREQTPASTIFKGRVLGNYIWSQTIDAVQKDEPEWQTALSGQIRDANERLLQARNIEKLDAQTIALLALTNKKVGIYPYLQEQINKRLITLCDQSPIYEDFSKSDVAVLHSSDVTQNAWLLNACCTLNLGSAERKHQLAQYLLSKLRDGGWMNHVENSTCFLALKRALEARVITLTDKISEKTTTNTNHPTINRVFAADDAKSKVWKDHDGNWHASCGSKVITKIQFYCFKDDRQFVLTDYVPAGTQPLAQEAPQGTATDMKEYPEVNFYNNEWFQQLSFDKNQAKAYALEINPGEFYLSYKSRALCPGRYIIPPAHFASVYDDSVVQFSKPDVLIIE
jgi:hypothetical protein